MDRFRESYIQKCTELRQEPLPSILQQLDPKRSGERHPDRLDLCNQNMTVKACLPLAEALRGDILFTRLDLSDSFLGDDGCILIANALKSNDTIKELCLRGNNIRVDGANALASMLKVNRTIQKIDLEWNSLGIWDSALQGLSDALSVNSSLEELDLRNNRISPQGVATIARGISHNSSLKRLDLRWNNAGVIGARALLESIELNQNIIDVDVSGNEVPEDLLKSINIALERHKDQFQMKNTERQRVLFLDQEFQQLANSHRHHVEQLAGELELKTKEFDSTRRTMQKKLDEASIEIEKTHGSYRALEAKVMQLSCEQEKWEKKIDLVEQTLTNERTEHLKIVKSLHQELEHERTKRIRLEEIQSKAVGETTKRILTLEASLRDLEVREDLIARDKQAIEQELVKALKRNEEFDQILEEQLKKKEDQYRRKYSALERAKDEEIKDIVSSNEDRIRHLEDRLKQTENLRSKYEDELDQYKSRNIQTKTQFELRMQESERKIRQEEEEKRKDLESQYQSTKRQRDQIQQDFDRLVQRHQQEILEMETKLSSERKLRLKAEEEYHEYRNNNASNEKLVKTLQDNLVDYANLKSLVPKLQEQLSQKDSLIIDLREEVEASKEDEISRMKELEGAISGYIRNASSRNTNRGYAHQ